MKEKGEVKTPETSADPSNDRMGKEQASDYDFIREQIKERPINRKRLLRRTLLTAGLAVIFGVIACITFLLLEPLLSKMVSSDKEVEMTVVSLPAPAEEEEEIPQVEISEDGGDKIHAQSVNVGEEEENPVVEVETPIEEMSLSDEDVETGETVAAPAAGEEPVQGQSIPAPTVIYERAELELEDYRQLYRGMYAMSEEVSKSLVTITGVSSNEDWLSESFQSTRQEVGLIIAENGYELLILADSSRLQNVDSIHVTFYDGSSGSLREKSVDKETGLAVYAILLNSLSDEMRIHASDATAVLGSSYASSILGNAVIAVGSPLGTTSVGYGAVTSVNRLISYSDASYQLLTTDITGSENGSGILVNLRGQVVGVICQQNAGEGMENLIHAFGISSIRKLVENLTNAVELPSLGVYFSEVPADVAEELGIPKGVCVTRLEMDSPAMKAGLLKGDIIQMIGGMQCATAVDFMNALQSQVPGESTEIIYARTNGESYRSVTLDVILGEKDTAPAEH